MPKVLRLYRHLTKGETMIIKGKSIRKPPSTSWSRVIIACFAVMTFLAPINIFGQLNLWDAAQGLPDLDNRMGSVAPTATQLSTVESLGAKAEWNQFGTIHTMVKYGGRFPPSPSCDPVSCALHRLGANSSVL